MFSYHEMMDEWGAKEDAIRERFIELDLTHDEEEPDLGWEAYPGNDTGEEEGPHEIFNWDINTPF